MIGLALVLLGCTIDSKSVGEEGSSTGDTTSATDATEATSSESGVLMCEQFESADEIGPAVDIVVRNAAAQTVWFAHSGGCGSASPAYTLTNAAGEDVRYRFGDCFARLTCAQILRAGGCTEDNCQDEGDCAPPRAGRMDAGATAETRWVGRQLSTLDVDPQCAVDDDCAATCERVDQAPPGTYEISVTVYRSCTGECACDDGLPECALWDSDELGDPVTYTATIDYPAQTSVEIVVDDG